jgi:hypothetical protein
MQNYSVMQGKILNISMRWQRDDNEMTMRWQRDDNEMTMRWQWDDKANKCLLLFLNT